MGLFSAVPHQMSGLQRLQVDPQLNKFPQKFTMSHCNVSWIHGYKGEKKVLVPALMFFTVSLHRKREVRSKITCNCTGDSRRQTLCQVILIIILREKHEMNWCFYDVDNVVIFFYCRHVHFVLLCALYALLYGFCMYSVFLYSLCITLILKML